VVLPDPPVCAELPIDLPAGARWGVALSHDVDHLGLREHLVDGFLVRYAANLVRQNLVHRFRPGRVLDRCWGIAQAAWGRDRWDVTTALMEQENRAGFRASWFIPVRPGRGIAFDLSAAGALARRLVAAGHEVGLHGQASTDAAALAAEAHDLTEACGTPVAGLRMHYLQLTEAVLEGMGRSGLRFDSTTMERKGLDPDVMPLPGPQLARPGIVEFPLHVMDSTLFSATGLGLDLEDAREYTRRLLARAAREERLLVINLHPNSYSSQSPEIRDWFDFLLGELQRRSDVHVAPLRDFHARVRIA
jgi:peptidoglycan/xylan/chitin deacetylase (PgdA/CDA1 family)